MARLTSYNIKTPIFIISMLLGIGMLFAYYQYVYAQDIQIYTADDIFLETSPEIPGPEQDVSLTLNSYSFNLNNHYITWFQDGQKVSTGFGNKHLNFRTGITGVSTDIVAIVEVDGQVYRKEFRFTPSQIDLIWEAVDAYTPPFYKGKKLPVTESLIHVTAIPETQLIAPADAPQLIYYWDSNYKRDSVNSGFGKNYYAFRANPINTEERITVTSNDRRENSFATNTVIIPTEKHPIETIFYAINEQGRLLMNRALNNFNIITEPQIKLSFHPFNISTTQANFTDLFVNWKINNDSQAPQNFSRQNELFIAPKQETGSSLITVQTEGIKNISQQHEESFRITFTQ